MHALFMYCAYTVYIFKNIKNGSHDTIHTFKNYFALVFSVSVKISCIQTDPQSYPQFNMRSHSGQSRVPKRERGISRSCPFISLGLGSYHKRDRFRSNLSSKEKRSGIDWVDFTCKIWSGLTSYRIGGFNSQIAPPHSQVAKAQQQLHPL